MSTTLTNRLNTFLLQFNQARAQQPASAEPLGPPRSFATSEPAPPPVTAASLSRFGREGRPFLAANSSTERFKFTPLPQGSSGLNPTQVNYINLIAELVGEMDLPQQDAEKVFQVTLAKAGSHPNNRLDYQNIGYSNPANGNGLLYLKASDFPGVDITKPEQAITAFAKRVAGNLNNAGTLVDLAQQSGVRDPQAALRQAATHASRMLPSEGLSFIPIGTGTTGLNATQANYVNLIADKVKALNLDTATAEKVLLTTLAKASTHPNSQFDYQNIGYTNKTNGNGVLYLKPGDYPGLDISDPDTAIEAYVKRVADLADDGGSIIQLAERAGVTNAKRELQQALVHADNMVASPTFDGLKEVIGTLPPPPPPPAEGPAKRVSQTGLDLIKSFEGLRLNAYRDPVGIWTIGYGITNPRYAFPGNRITAQKAEELLREEVDGFTRGVVRAIGNSREVNQNQLDAFVSFAYNVGIGAFQNSTMLRLFKQGASLNRVAQEFDRWVNAGGRRLAGLVRRRNAEQALFLGENHRRFL